MKSIDNISDPILRQDIQSICDSEIIRNFPDGSTFFVTGATGLLGIQIVTALVCCEKDLRVIALARSSSKAELAFGKMLDNPRLQLHIGDVVNPLNISENIDYIIHGASPTSSRFFVENPVQTIFTALNGTRNVLDLAIQKRVRKLVYLSSLEVYGVPSSTCETILETDYGTIDPIQVRSSYSEGKRMAECLCAAYCSQYGTPVTVARLTQTFGSGASYNDGRVFAQFARCAIEGRDIVLHTEGSTVRSYCYTTDAVRAIFLLLQNGVSGEAYNITNMKTAVSIRELADMVCSLVPEQNIQVQVRIPKDVSKYGYNPDVVIRLNSEKLQALGWNPEVNLAEMLTRLIGSMRYSRD